jgi:homoprotocatechuate degradation regulator HpaR
MPDPDLRLTRRSLPIALLRARERVMEPIRDMLGRSGVSEQKWRVLRVLDEGGAMDLTRLATESCLLLPSLTRMVGPMQAEGLIATERPAADRRRVVVAITAQGRALLARHAAESAAIFARIEDEFGPERLEALLDLLEHLRGLDLRRGRGGDGLG